MPENVALMTDRIGRIVNSVNGVEIEDTFAEAFGLWGARVVITARDFRWAREAASRMIGFATSIIACGCEAGIEAEKADTPDGRPGVSVLVFARTKDLLIEQLVDRIGQCVLTCPTTACFNGLTGEEQVSVGGRLRFFGDGFQISKIIGERRYWRVPVMEGEFLIEELFGVQLGVGGGNILILASDQERALESAGLAVEAMRRLSGIVLPFPGGIVRSGSKVGSRYRFLIASTNHAFCPTLRGQVASSLPEGVGSALEIVVDGLDITSVCAAMRAGILAACIPGVRRISAGNYGGRLGKRHIYLRDILDAEAE